MLTLINGERIKLSERVSLLFELDDLSAASPATVSRCGIVYFGREAIRCEPYMESWRAEMIREVEADPELQPFQVHREEICKLAANFLEQFQTYFEE